jgi:hypothetical protein
MLVSAYIGVLGVGLEGAGRISRTKYRFTRRRVGNI